MRKRDFWTSGVRVGRAQGVDLWIHWTLFVLFGIRVYQRWVPEPEGAIEVPWETDVLYLCVLPFCVILSILLHEIGHVYAARRVGGTADAIVLWPLGGLAFCDAPRTPRAQFWVAAGGPLASVGVAVLLALFLFVLLPLADSAGAIVRDVASEVLFLTIVITVFNLLPLYPFDGGRIFQALAWARTGSYGRATLATVWATRISCAAGILLTFVEPFHSFRWFLYVFLVWALIEGEKLRHEAREGDDDHVFGYDFSHGYTSLDRTAPRDGTAVRRPGWLEKLRRRRAEKQREREAAVRQQVDGLLEKISQSGLASLSNRERRFLEDASRRLNRSGNRQR